MEASEHNRLKALVLTALFAGTAAAGGYILMAVPNVELITAILFLAGYVLGVLRGLTAAMVAGLLYFGLNPQGGLFPPLLAAQLTGMAAAPLAGSLVAGIPMQGWRLSFILGLTGMAVTIWYDLLTNLAFPLAVGFDVRGIIATLILGIPFAVVHIGSNAAIFAIVLPPLIRLVRRHQLKPTA